MAKIYINFDGELFNAFWIEKIERIEQWNDTELRQEYGIIINREVNPGISPITDLKFMYESFELREQKIIQLKEKLEMFPKVVII